MALSLSWTDLCVEANGKKILHSLSGRLEAGGLLAVMGTSGAGKSTFLLALARRGPVTGGEVHYSGATWSAALRRKVAYVEQDDLVFPELTMRETLTYASLLRLPARTAVEQAACAARVEELLYCKCSRRNRTDRRRVGRTSRPLAALASPPY